MKIDYRGLWKKGLWKQTQILSNTIWTINIVMHRHTSFLASSAISFSFTMFFIIAIPANLLASNFLSSSSFLLWISLLILRPSWILTSSAICLWSSLNYLTQNQQNMNFIVLATHWKENIKNLILFIIVFSPMAIENFPNNLIFNFLIFMFLVKFSLKKRCFEHVKKENYWITYWKHLWF